MTAIHPQLAAVTERIIERSRPTRQTYLNRIKAYERQGRVERDRLGCSNLAHGYASMPKTVKIQMQQPSVPNLGIITSYNDMVSAHQPFKDFPDLIKDEAQNTARRHKWPAARPRCATASHKATKAWNFHCFRAT